MNSPLPWLAALVLAASGCDSVARPVAGGDGDRSPCTACHGDATRDEPTPTDKAAPPAAFPGHDAGAHLAHLHGGPFRGRIACSECHVVPDATSHTNGRIELTFGSTASANGVAASFSKATGTCTVWCHGTLLSGGPAASPAWTDRSPAQCGDCHGAPPPNHAPTSTNCSACHPGTVDASRNILVANGLHMNGVIDAAGAHAPGWSDPGNHGPAAKDGLASCTACHGADFNGGTSGVSCNACHGGTGWQTDCTFCHGDATRAGSYKGAPPVGAHGETLTTQRAVGAHLRHLAGGGVGPAVDCSECHTVPTTLGHVNGTATVTFGPVASRGGRTPSWNTGNLSCSSTSCHGSAQPVWTGGSSQAACGTCHGVPPSGHSTGSCGTCHTGYTSTTVNGSLHMNGNVDAIGGHPSGWAAKDQHGYQANQAGLSGCKACHGSDLAGGSSGVSCATCHGAGWDTNCTFCHGTPGLRASPPVDTQGRTARSNVSVGAHEKHATATLSSPLGCGACHASRGSVITDGAHVDGGPAEVALSGVGAGTFTRVSDTSATCSTYCHGVFPGGKNASVSWVSTTAMDCSTCHASPPPAPHVQRSDCGACHTGYTASTVSPATHVNGTVDHVTMTCTSCHGKVGQSATAAAPLNAAPPTDTTGAATGNRVGAHQKHLLGGAYANAFPCQTCHANVGGYTVTHANSQREVGFGGASSANLRLGTWTAGAGGAAGSCSATWCHGAVINRNGGTSGGTATVPTWTAAISACTACHAVTGSALPNNHTRSQHRVACTICHGPGYDSSGSPPTGSAANLATHVDGTKTIVTVPTGTGIRSWNPSTRSCTPSCHGNQTW
jgi:predicted CxxxxCH...CXXCH cytochrome family protein